MLRGFQAKQGAAVESRMLNRTRIHLRLDFRKDTLPAPQNFPRISRSRKRSHVRERPPWLMAGIEKWGARFAMFVLLQLT